MQRRCAHAAVARNGLCARSVMGMQQNSWKEQRSSATTASHSKSSNARRKASRQAMRAVYARAQVEQNVVKGRIKSGARLQQLPGIVFASRIAQVSTTGQAGTRLVWNMRAVMLSCSQCKEKLDCTLCPASQQQHAIRDKRRRKACEAKLQTWGSPKVASVTGRQTKRIRVHAFCSNRRLTIVK